MPTAALAVTEDTADSTVVWLQATPDWYAWFLGEREYTSTVSIAVLAAAGLLSTELDPDSSESTGIVLVLLNGNATETTSDTTADGGYVTVFASADAIEGRDTATARVETEQPKPASSGGRRMRQPELEWQEWPTFGPVEARQRKRRRQELLLLAA
jgi:hypothetical protein